MPREYGRNKRVADLVQRELADMIPREETDTGIALLTVSYVDVSPDLSFARVYVTCMDSSKSRDEVVDTLNEFAGHFRHQLSKKLALRIVPRLKFVYDESIERGVHLNALIDSLSKK
jgi:ribosome-binding factor A